MPAPAKKINLLPQSEFEVSFWGKFLKWAVTTGRYIIILTELVVIVAFLSRFKLDSDISNLHSQINGKKNILNAQYVTEQKFRKVQNQLNAARDILNQNLDSMGALDEVLKDKPEEIKLTYVQVTKKDIQLQAMTLNEQVLGQMLEKIAKNNKWSGVELTQVQADKIKGISFALVVKR